MWPKLWRALVSGFGVIVALTVLLSVSEIPEWLDRWSKILRNTDESTIKYVFYIICGLILVVTNLPWIQALKKRHPIAQNDTETNENTEGTSQIPGRRVADKARRVQECTELLDRLLIEAPTKTTSRKKAESWAGNVVVVLSQMFSQQDGVAFRAAVGDLSDPETSMREAIIRGVLHLQAVKATFHESQIRTGYSDEEVSKNSHAARRAVLGGILNDGMELMTERPTEDQFDQWNNSVDEWAQTAYEQIKLYFDEIEADNVLKLVSVAAASYRGAISKQQTPLCYLDERLKRISDLIKRIPV